MALGIMGVGPLDLYETLAADGLVAAASVVEIGWVVEKADGTLGGILVEVHFEWLAIDERVVR